MRDPQETGRLGELAARRHLEALNYAVLETNARKGRNEIDIVAEDDGVLVFVEVRSRRSRNMGTPEESITPQKGRRMLEAAHQYLADTGNWERPWRIDIVAVEIDRLDRVARLSVIPNALEL